MGAWGADSFENDGAYDFLARFYGDPGRGTIEQALTFVTEIGDGYLESPECGSAIAAAEFVAALKNSPNPRMPDAARKSLIENDTAVDQSLVGLALQAVARIMAGSEMKELWDDTAKPETKDRWYAAVADLRGSVEGVEARIKSSGLETYKVRVPIRL